MKHLQRFFAVVITLLSIFIVVMVLITNETTSSYFSFFTNIFSSYSEVIASESGNFEPLSGSGDLVSSSQISSLEDSNIDGSEYNFETLYYPYYGMLDSSEQAIYSQIYANAIELKESFIPVTEISVSELTDVMEAVYSDHPELFYLSTKYAYVYTENKIVAQITLSYNSLINDISSARNSFNSAALIIINEASTLSSDYEKEKYVHDAIANLASYNEDASLGQSAYSALVSGASVCAGYSRAFQYIMTELGIPTYFVSGTATGNHAWNMVMLDDEYYNVDLTWDDQDSGIIYNYFNLSDADFSSTHTRTGLALNLPSCDGSEYSGLESVATSPITSEGLQPNSTPSEASSTAENTQSLPADKSSETNINKTVPDNTQTFPDKKQSDSGLAQGGPNRLQGTQNNMNQRPDNIRGN